MRPVLFLHGAPGDARVWTPVLDQLPALLDARALTLSFFGSDRVAECGADFGTERHRDDIAAFIEATMEPPVMIVAWSYSVHPALLTALTRPDLVAGMLLYEPGLPTYVTAPERLAMFEADAQAAFGPVAAALNRKDHAAAVAALLDASGGEGCFDRLPPDRRRVYLESAGVMPLLMGEGRPPARITAEDVRMISVPVTVGLGERSRPVFEIPSKALARELPDGCLEIISDTDHMLPETDPQRFAGIVLEWLRPEKENA